MHFSVRSTAPTSCFQLRIDGHCKNYTFQISKLLILRSNFDFCFFFFVHFRFVRPKNFISAPHCLHDIPRFSTIKQLLELNHVRMTVRKCVARISTLLFSLSISQYVVEPNALRSFLLIFSAISR